MSEYSFYWNPELLICVLLTTLLFMKLSPQVFFLLYDDGVFSSFPSWNAAVLPTTQTLWALSLKRRMEAACRPSAVGPTAPPAVRRERSAAPPRWDGNHQSSLIAEIYIYSMLCKVWAEKNCLFGVLLLILEDGQNIRNTFRYNVKEFNSITSYKLQNESVTITKVEFIAGLLYYCIYYYIYCISFWSS